MARIGNGVRAASATLVLFVLSATAAEVDAAPRIEITVPSDAIGDGQTPIPIQIEIQGVAGGTSAASIELRTSGGSIGTAEATADGFGAELIPPIVAASMAISVSAKALVGKRVLHATQQLPLLPHRRHGPSWRPAGPSTCGSSRRPCS